MKRILIGLVAAAALPGLAMAQTVDQNKTAQDKMEKVVPEMKNPAGTKDLHPPQKAMDEATPAKPGASSGASSGESGSSKTWSSQEGESSGKPAAPKQ